MVGVATRKGVWIGADSGSVAGEFSRSVPEPKVWKAGEWIVACAGSWRALELMKYTVKLPRAPKLVSDLHRVICIDVVDEIRKAFSARGVADAVELDSEDGAAWLALIGVRTPSGGCALYYLEAEHAERVSEYAVGLGDEFAMGVLSCTRQTPPALRLRNAFNRTRAHYGALRSPFRVEAL